MKSSERDQSEQTPQLIDTPNQGGDRTLPSFSGEAYNSLTKTDSEEM